MGRLVDGVWTTHDLGADEQGRFVRRAARFRGRIGDAAHPPEAGRYRLYASRACPWSHRALILRALAGLEDAVPVTYLRPFMGADGWTLEDGTPVWRAVYLRADPTCTGRASVPVLVDERDGSIVSNESRDVVASLEAPLRPFARRAVEWFPAARETAVDAMIEANYGPVNDGVYRCGFAASQKAYDEAAGALFGRLDELEALLSRQRYLLGSEITGADWFLFPTLYRFDSVYYVHFKCCLRPLTSYPSLWAYTRELYQWPGVRETCDMAEIKEHYFTSHESIHPRRYVPLGPAIDFDAPHGRTG